MTCKSRRNPYLTAKESCNLHLRYFATQVVRFVAKWLGSLDPHGSVQTVTICDGTSLDSQDAELPGPLLPVLSDLAPGYTDYTDKADYTAEHDSQRPPICHCNGMDTAYCKNIATESTEYRVNFSAGG